MSSPRKPAARLELTPDMDVFATKEEPPSPPAQRAEPRSAAVPTPREKPPAKVRPPPPSRGVQTTIAIPEPVMERIQVWLQNDREHNMRSMVLYALTQIGIDVEPEHLKPTRRRWSR